MFPSMYIRKSHILLYYILHVIIILRNYNLMQMRKTLNTKCEKWRIMHSCNTCTHNKSSPDLCQGISTTFDRKFVESLRLHRHHMLSKKHEGFYYISVMFSYMFPLTYIRKSLIFLQYHMYMLCVTVPNMWNVTDSIVVLSEQIILVITHYSTNIRFALLGISLL